MYVQVKAVFMKSNVTWQLAYILRFANAIREYLFFLPEVRSLSAYNLLAGKHRAVPPITVVLIDFFFNVLFPVEEIR